MPPQYIRCDADRYVKTLGGQLSKPACTPARYEDNTPYGATVTVTMELTPDEITELFSALMTGADLIYPDKSHELLWLFWQALECP